MDDDEVVIVSSPAASGPASVPGSMLVPCVDCKQPAWVSPSSFEILATGSDVLCYVCLKRRVDAKPNEPVRIMKPSRATIAEVEMWRRRL